MKSWRENVDQSAFDAAVAGNESVTVKLLLGHAEIVAAVRDQLVGLFEGAVIEQELDALPRRHFAFLVLAFAALFASALVGEPVTFLQFCKLFFEIHVRKDYSGYVGQAGARQITWREKPRAYRPAYPQRYIAGFNT